MLHKLEAGEKQVPYLIDFIWLGYLSSQMSESEKPAELHVNQLKECKILEFFTIMKKKKTTNKINQES